MRPVFLPTFCLLLCGSTLRADVDLEVRPTVRTHREHITRSPHTFVIRTDADDIRPFSKRAVIDDVLQSVTIEGAAVNPYLRVPGMPDLRSAETLLASILKPGMTDYEKALAIHAVVARFSIYTSSPSRTTWGVDDPIFALNCGAGICGNITVWTKALAWKAGLPARTYEITTHTVPEIFYDGRWHMFDPTTWTFYIGRDNRSVASVRELELALDVMKRAAAGRRDLGWYRTAKDNHVGGNHGQNGRHMHLRLRRGETLTRLTDKDGPSLWSHDISRRKQYATGFLKYAPDLARDDLDEVLKAQTNLTRDANRVNVLRPEKPGMLAVATFHVASPYPLTQATLTGRFGTGAPGAKLRVLVTAYAPGMVTWTKEVFTARAPGIAQRKLDLTPHVFGADRYDVRFEMHITKPDEPTGIANVAFENVLHLNRYSLPHLTGGENRITYVDDGNTRDVTVTYNWREKHPIRCTPFPPMRYRENTLKVFVKNRGDEEARNVEVAVEQLWTRDKFSASSVIDRIGPGQTGTAEVAWRPGRSRTAWLRVTVDPKNAIAESNEENNAFQRGMRVVWPAEISVTPSQIALERTAGRAKLEALLINTGGLPARDVRVRFLTGDGKTGRTVGETVVPVVHTRWYTSESISPFAWATLELDAAKLTGTHLGVHVDPEGKLGERNRKNHIAWLATKNAARRPPAAAEVIPEADPLVFYSFEPGRDMLRNAEWSELTDAREVSEHATHGQRAARLTCPAKKTGKFRIVYDGEVPMPKRWDTYTRLRLDVYNASTRSADVIVRPAALKGSGTSKYDAAFELPPRKQVTLEVPLDLIARADLRHVERLEVIIEKPETPVTLTVDNFRLLRRGRPAKLPMLRAKTLRVERPADPIAVEAEPIALTSADDLAHFPNARHVVIADDFGSPASPRGARFEIKSGRSIGLTLDLSRKDSPWPTDWTKYRRLSFHAKRKSDQPFVVSLKLRSSHPEHGVRYVGRSFAVRTDGAKHFIDLEEIKDRLDLDHMSRITWFIWRPRFEGTLWLGDLRLEK